MEKEQTFGEFIKNYSFVIPDYQRAYSWGEKQLNPFINDILEHCDENDNPTDDTRYYLGHYILEKTNYDIANLLSEEEYIRIKNEGFSISCDKFEIIDGQQRITTVYLFLMVCGYKKNKNYIKDISFKPVSYDLEGLEKIKAILEANEFVNSKLEDLLTSEKTMSLARMVMAVQLFIDAFEGKIQKLDVNNIEKYVKVIYDAYCSLALFQDKAVASQIFELHNTRGIALSETEKVKSLLMKSVYLNSPTPDTDIEKIQEAFASVFKMEEKVSENWLRGDMPLDTVLMYHLRAVEDGKKDNNFNSPNSISGENGSFEYVRKAIALKGNNKNQIIEYSKDLAFELTKTMNILVNEIPEADKINHLIGDVLLLDKNRSMLFLLRSFRIGNPNENNLIERWENFLLCYEIIYNRYYYNAKASRENFESIYKSISPDSDLNDCNNLLIKYYKNEQGFSYHWEHLGENAKKLFDEDKNKWIHYAYGWEKTAYFLYKYEIGNKGDLKKIRETIFKGNTVSIDHIVARGIEWKDLGFENYPKEKKEEADIIWNKITEVINGIGNLSLSTASANSSDSNNLPSEHTISYEKFGLLNTVQEINTWNEPIDFADRIADRTKNIRNFISKSIINRNDIWE